MKKALESSSLRANLLGDLQDLADREVQLNEWTSKTAAHRFWDTLRMSLEDLDGLGFFDKDEEAKSGRGLIGYCVYDQKELDVIYPVIHALDYALDEIGLEQPDVAYINSPLWDDVVKTADHAFDVLMANEPADSLYRQRPYYLSKKKS